MDENIYKIYMYTNIINNKKYIGRTKNSLIQRSGKNGNKYYSCVYFGNAIKKYGWENFQPEILEDGLSYEEACEKEEYYIKKYETNNHLKGYNLHKGGEGPTKECLQKMRESHLNKHLSEEHRRKISESLGQGVNNVNYGRKHTDEMKRKNSEAKKGEKHPNWGKHLKQETKDKIREKVSKPIYQCDLENNIIKRWDNGYDPARFYDVSIASINSCVCRNENGGQHTSLGYKWYRVKDFKFKDKEKEFLNKENKD